MATFVIKDRPTWLGAVAIGDIAHTIAIDYGCEAQDDTVLTDTTRSNAGGLETFGFSMDAYADFTVKDSQLFSGVGGSSPLTLSSQSGADDEVAFLINTTQLVHSPFGGSVGDMAGTNISGAAADRLVRGIIEFNNSTSSSGTTTGSQLGAVASGSSIYANLHVTAAAGSSLDVIVQSDDNSGFSSATNRITFTQATGITSEHLSLGGSITDDYWRISYTIAGGSFTFAVALGIA